MRYLLLLLLTTMFIFCNTNRETSITLDSLEKQGTTHSADEVTLRDPKSEGIEGCYILILKRDTMVLHLESSQKLSGKLTFDNFEKDGSSGIVTGTRDGDILKFKYSFASEGMHSVMDVYFKVDGEKLIRGTGDMQTKDDTAYFTNPGKVDFTDSNHFKKTPCEAIPAKYRL